MDWKELFSIRIYHGYIFQILLAEVLFTLTLRRREHFGLRVVSGGIVYGLLSLIIPNFISQYVSGFFSLSIFLLSVGLCAFCFKDSFQEILFCCVGAQLTQNLSYNMENLIYQPFADRLPYWGWFLISVGTMAVVYTVCYGLFARRMYHVRSVGVNRIGVCFFSLTAALFVYVMQYLLQINKIDTLWVTRPPLILCCIFGLCVQFEWIALVGRREENLFLEKMLQKENRQYEITKTSIDLINMKAHDLKHQITRIRNLKNVQDPELDEIESVIDAYELNNITGNKTLDVILAEKQLVCRKHGIQMTVMADGSALSFFNTADIAAMFGNALDNAIECECKIREKEKRCISLDVHTKGNMLSIRVENYCPEEQKAEEGFFVTSKPDRNNHGFGLRSIRYIAKKYEGTVWAGVRNHLFILSILFQIPESDINNICQKSDDICQ